jgi:single-strand DNA-binding protein
MTTVTIVGRLTDAPSLRFTGTGKAVAGFTVAENHRKKDASGEWQDGLATYWDCTVWEQTAENLAEANLSKGARVIVTGDTYTEAFTRKDGTDGKAMRVRVTEVGASLRGFSGGSNGGNGGGNKQRSNANDDPWAAIDSSTPPF